VRDFRNRKGNAGPLTGLLAGSPIECRWLALWFRVMGDETILKGLYYSFPSIELGAN
jgi:hypothetical protein